MFRPFVLNTGPLPDVFGCGTLTPFLRRQAANRLSACRNRGLLTRLKPLRAPGPPPRKSRPPRHLLMALCSCARVTPLGRLPPPRNKPRAPPGRVGSCTPCFCRHSRTALKRAWGPVAPRGPVVPPEEEVLALADPVAVLVAAAFACVAVVEPPDPPQAVSPSAAMAPAASTTLSGRPSASLICCIKSLVSLRVISTLPCLLAE